MENCKIVIQKRWSQSLKGGAGYTLYPSACLRGKKGQWRHQNYEIIKDKRKSSRLIDAKRLFQEIKSVSFFHILRTGVCACIDNTLLQEMGSWLLLILFKRYEVSTFEIHLDSVDNLSEKKKKNRSKASFKNDQSEGQETLTSCKVVKSTFMVRA